MNQNLRIASKAIQSAARVTCRQPQHVMLRAATATASNARYLTLPPGSVRRPPFRESNGTADHSHEHHTMLFEGNVRPVEVAMSPHPRRYSTSLDAPEYYTLATRWDSDPTPFASTTGYSEDYDEWRLDGSASGVTRSDLGQFTTTESVMTSIPFYETYQSEEYSSSSVDDGFVELEEDAQILHDSIEYYNGDDVDCSLEF